MDVMIVEPDRAAGNPPAAMPATREECRTRLTTLRDEIAAIKLELAAADLERQARHGRMDRRWYEQRKAALRDKLRRSADLSAHMATLPRRKDTLKDSVIEVVRADYDDDDWQRVLDEAHRRLETREGV
ncbi:MAG: hypothetical protein HQL34_05305 [Alphaproteobacteria bacterium]|nr:hypothetical protein [Alphaproteobacteria bacterium]